MIGSNEAPNGVRNSYDPLEASIIEELDSLSPLSPLRCIYRVPERLRQGNEKTYTPQVVSIGPLHHGKEHLKAMEKHKMRYLGYFLGRSRVSVKDYINIIQDKEEKLRSYYAESIGFGSDQFVRIVLVDAAFIIEFLLRRFLEFRDENDYIFDKPMMLFDVWPDLRMLENQLPFFILEDLFDPDKYFAPTHRYSMLYISYFSFKCTIYRQGTEVDLERLCSSGIEARHFVDVIRLICLPSTLKEGGKLRTLNAPTMTELHQAGVKFKSGSTKNIFDIRFANGILEIPKFRISDSTEVTIRNLVAFEQCHYKEKYISDYVTVMDWLVNTRKDVGLLVKHGIVEHSLGDTNKVSTLINNLGKGLAISYDDFHFGTLCEELNTYCGTPWNKWKANLRQTYLNTPWAIISVTAATFLLILTFIQAACSIKSIA